MQALLSTLVGKFEFAMTEKAERILQISILVMAPMDEGELERGIQMQLACSPGKLGVIDDSTVLTGFGYCLQRGLAIPCVASWFKETLPALGRIHPRYYYKFNDVVVSGLDSFRLT